MKNYSKCFCAFISEIKKGCMSGAASFPNNSKSIVMSDVKLIGAAQAKVVPLQQHKNEISLTDFFSFYGSHTNAIMIGFLDNVYNEYLKTEAWNYSTISEKAFSEFNYQLLRKLLQNLKR